MLSLHVCMTYVILSKTDGKCYYRILKQCILIRETMGCAVLHVALIVVVAYK